MSNRVTVGSFFGAFCCLGLALMPLPFDRWVGVRQASSLAAIGCGYFGWHDSQKKKEKLERQELWEFEQRLKQRALDAAVNSALTDVLVEEVVVKEKLRADASVEVYKAETQQNFVRVMAHDHPEILQHLLQTSQPPTTETKTVSDSHSETETDSVSDSVVDSVPGGVAGGVAKEKTAEEKRAEYIAAARSKLLKLIEEHEGGWIGQLMHKPLLIYGDMGSFKSYFAAFLALCRHYLYGHKIISIADPHFHQNYDECWKTLVKLGVPGYGANQNFDEVGQQLNAMYDRFKVRTLKDDWLTSIFDEMTQYGFEEGTAEPASKLTRKVVGDPRKGKEAPIFIAHNDTNAAFGGGDGFSKSVNSGVIKLQLRSDSKYQPLFKGTISGIKDEEGECIKDLAVSIAPYWIRPEWVYDLFNGFSSESDNQVISNSEVDQKPDLNLSLQNTKVELQYEAQSETQPEIESDIDKLNRALNQSVSWDYWLAESTTEELDRQIELHRSQASQKSDNLPDNSADNSSEELSPDNNLITGNITPKLLPREDYPVIWDAEDFARLLPNESETAVFERILELSDKYKSPSKLIQMGLGFTQGRKKPRSYSDVGKKCFYYIVMKYGTPSLIARYKDYLEKK
ncbi:hypothetical protein QUB10_08030 [Microcoleus sp. B5-D4]|uniref:hypothetical protein n=1 Tax=Microcoleus sp. B5-D4 TaxID=2818681 RepID=UPI002FD269A6